MHYIVVPISQYLELKPSGRFSQTRVTFSDSIVSIITFELNVHTTKSHSESMSMSNIIP